MIKNIYVNKNLVLMILIIITFPILLLNTTISMIDAWIVDGTYNHAFLIFPASVWLIYKKRNILSSLKSEPDTLAFLFLLFEVIILFLTLIVDTQIAQQIIMISIIITTIWAVLGREITLALGFPLLILFLAAPVGSSLVAPLMEFTADFTVFMIKLFGIPVYRDGLYFSLPTGNWSVIEACSGVRYLIASVSLGIIYAYITYSSHRKRIIFILFSIITPILANGLRAFGIVMVGHFSNMKYALGVDHLIFGWVFFGIILFILFFIGGYWADPRPYKEHQLKKHNSYPSAINNYSYSILITTTLLLVLTQVYASHIKNQEFEQKANSQISFSAQNTDWVPQLTNTLNWEPVITNPDEIFSKTFINENNLVQLSIGYYKNQSQGAEAINSMNRISSRFGGKWKKIAGTNLKAGNLYLTETVLRYGRTKILVWNWYRIGQLQTSNQYLAKTYNAYNLIFEERNDASVLSIATPLLDENKKRSQEILMKFLSTFQNQLDHELDSL